MDPDRILSLRRFFSNLRQEIIASHFCKIVKLFTELKNHSLCPFDAL
jgi:hypothetical protein